MALVAEALYSRDAPLFVLDIRLRGGVEQKVARKAPGKQYQSNTSALLPHASSFSTGGVERTESGAVASIRRHHSRGYGAEKHL